MTEPAEPLVIPRAEFLDTRWHYRAGEHVTFLGPTRSGKTTLAFELLGRTATVRTPAVVLAMKPRDATVSAWTTDLKYKLVRSWPPPPLLWQRRPNGFTLWPKHTFDPDRDNVLLHKVFRTAILDSYKHGDRILFADELYGLCAELRLEKELITVWSRGGAMGCALWGGTQRPAYVPQWAYNQAEHLFLHNDPDKRSRQRYAEIGGIDPRFVERITLGLRKHQWLYIHRDGPRYCIVDR